MYGVEYPIYEQFYDKFEPPTRGGSRMRRIRYGSTTDGDGWQAEFAASLAKFRFGTANCACLSQRCRPIPQMVCSDQGWPHAAPSKRLAPQPTSPWLRIKRSQFALPTTRSSHPSKWLESFLTTISANSRS